MVISSLLLSRAKFRLRKMRNLQHIFIACMWMAYLLCCVEATYESLSRNPLDGSAERWPTGGAGFVNNDLTRLLDVGASISGINVDPDWSFVPPLDGTSSSETLAQDQYAMKLVLFDVQLVELKNIDPVGGSFQVEFQIILYWVEPMINGSEGTIYNDDCRFPCDTKSATPLCCDKVWVPPLHLPRCDINKVQSSTRAPYVNKWFGEKPLSYSDCFKAKNKTERMGIRLWYLNIDATCASNMDFRLFPFDVQKLSIDISNPHASRTWFQRIEGLLEANIDEDIIIANLSTDAKIPGWNVAADLNVSRTCSASKNWRQTFLAQDNLLKALNDTYVSQKDDIDKALDPNLCSIENNFYKGLDDIDFSIPSSYILYEDVCKNYSERVTNTLEMYKKCTQEKGKAFYWNLSSYDEAGNVTISNFGSFQTSTKNINRSFNILDLVKQDTMANVSFNCAIFAIANLTTRGIQVTIDVRRYHLFYVVKLILPTIACVAFSFAAFGLHPKELIGRLTVVVPSAIALTTLQSLVVSTDIPPVAYIPPSTYIFLFSYLVQILISFESILVSSLTSKSGCWRKRRNQVNKRRRQYASGMSGAISGADQMINSEEHRENIHTSQNIQQTHVIFLICKMDCIRILDLLLMALFAIVYIVAVGYCIYTPWRKSQNKRNGIKDDFSSLWLRF